MYPHVVLKISHDSDEFDRAEAVYADIKESLRNASDAQVKHFAESVATRIRPIFDNAEFWWIDAISVDADNLLVQTIDSWQVGELTSWRDV